MAGVAVTFGSDLAAGLAELRAHAASRMRATCKIERKSGQSTNSDGVTSTTFTQVYSGACYLRYPGLAQEAVRDVAGAQVVESRIVVRIPFGTVCKPGDRVTITADPDNSQLVNTVLRIESIDDQSQATAQRLLCSDLQSGGV